MSETRVAHRQYLAGFRECLAPHFDTYRSMSISPVQETFQFPKVQRSQFQFPSVFHSSHNQTMLSM